MWKYKVLSIKFEFKIQDCWIGVFWKQDNQGINHAWLCVLPCIPLHIQWERVFVGEVNDIPF